MILKKLLLPLICLLLIIMIGVALFFNKKDSDLTKVKLGEVAHSIFYAPQYVAHALGYFEDEELDVEITLISGADKVAAAVLSGDINIGFCGTEATIYIYNQGEEDYLVTFSGLTKRDGSFIVSREQYDDFELSDLIGKDIIGGREGGMPEMTFEWALSQNGIDPEEDVNIDTSIAFAAMAGAFIGGTGDFVTLFEPQALKVEAQGYGYVVASVGLLGGEVPYTAYNAKKSYIEDNEDTISGFTKAIQKGLDYVHSHTSEEIAKIILSYFPDTSLNDLTSIVERYKNNDSWYQTTEIGEEDFNRVQTIMENANQLSKKAPYDKLIDNSFAVQNEE
ncbi:MAG: ABC transporter substrate-binding protein [Bacilli bacterium]|nr:ABC transporter substrate-binding protein [Bacilli bacterium]